MMLILTGTLLLRKDAGKQKISRMLAQRRLQKKHLLLDEAATGEFGIFKGF